jgi:hypothetical protein
MFMISMSRFDLLQRTWFEFEAPSPSVSVMLFDTAESGDAYDAEVEQSSRAELDNASTLQTIQ